MKCQLVGRSVVRSYLNRIGSHVCDDHRRFHVRWALNAVFKLETEIDVQRPIKIYTYIYIYIYK